MSSATSCQSSCTLMSRAAAAGAGVWPAAVPAAKACTQLLAGAAPRGGRLLAVARPAGALAPARPARYTSAADAMSHTQSHSITLKTWSILWRCSSTHAAMAHDGAGMGPYKITVPPCGASGWSRGEQQREHGGGGRVAHHLSRAGSVVLQQAGGLRRGSIELRGGGGSAPGVRSPVCQHVLASQSPEASTSCL